MFVISVALQYVMRSSSPYPSISCTGSDNLEVGMTFSLTHPSAFSLDAAGSISVLPLKYLEQWWPVTLAYYPDYSNFVP